MSGWAIQIASDIQRDGLGAELLNGKNEIVAEVFRCDRDNSLTLNTWDNDVPLPAIEMLIRVARKRLGEFDDGTPLPPSNDPN
jgi:hypothetical protein